MKQVRGRVVADALVAEVGQAAPGCFCLRPGTMVLETAVELVHIDPYSMLRRQLLRELEGEPVRVIEPEREIARQGRPPGHAQAVDFLLQQMCPLGQGLLKAL